MSIRQHVTLKPKTPGRECLLALSRQLSQFWTIDDAIAWQQNLDCWWQAHGHLTKERTLFRHGQCGYTHDRLCKAWLLLHNIVRQDVLFTYLLYGNPRTTSALDGGINNGIRTVLCNHRGITEEHMKRAAEWLLALEGIPIGRIHEFIAQHASVEPANVQPTNGPDDQPSLYDNELDSNEGLYLRAGWAGRG